MLGFQSPFLGRLGRACLATWLRWPLGVAEQGRQPIKGIGPVHLLRPIATGIDDQDAIGSHAPAGKPVKALPDRTGADGSGGIEAELNRRRDLVDVLSAGAGSPDEVPFQMAFIQKPGRGNGRHGKDLKPEGSIRACS